MAQCFLFVKVLRGIFEQKKARQLHGLSPKVGEPWGGGRLNKFEWLVGRSISESQEHSLCTSRPCRTSLCVLTRAYRHCAYRTHEAVDQDGSLGACSWSSRRCRMYRRLWETFLTPTSLFARTCNASTAFAIWTSPNALLARESIRVRWTCCSGAQCEHLDCWSSEEPMKHQDRAL